MGLREQVASRFKVNRWIGDEAIVSCPHPDHEDRNPSAAINVRKKLWTCYSCGRGGSLDQLFGSQFADPDVEDLLVEIASQLAGFDSEKHGYPESWLDQFDMVGPHPYWLERGLSEEVVTDFRLGYDYETDCATFPLRGPAGDVLGVVRRVLDDRRPKYRYPDHAPISKTLFGYYKARYGVKDLVLTEGALDALAMWDIGVPALAQMGATLSAFQAELIAKLAPSSITFAYDMDPAGHKATMRALENPALHICPHRVMRWDRTHGKDPLDLSPDDRAFFYEQAELR